MRVYLQSRELGQAVASALLQRGVTQLEVSKQLKITQGQLSHLVAGHFKTKNRLVQLVCDYANINPETFRIRTAQLDPKALDALARACGGEKHRTTAIIRV